MKLWILALSAIIFSQATDPITSLSGSSGWFGAGLLGLMMAWLLLVHLPRQEVRSDAKDKILLEKLEAKDAAYAEVIKLINESHSKELAIMGQHCRDDLDKITKTFMDRTDILMAYFHKTSGVQ